MVKHRIYTRHSRISSQDRLPLPLIRECIRRTLEAEGVDMACEVSVLITNDKNIRAINHEYRQIFEVTDVLSFPMLEFSPPGWTSPGSNAIDPETGLVPIGEVILSAPQVKRQAEQYRQTVRQETAYLTVHSILHLLGYDHVDEAEGKRQMREREKTILNEIRYSYE